MRNNSNPKNELGRLIFEKWRSNMKFVLDLEEFSYKDSGRDDPRFKFFKKQLMSNSYDAIRSLLEELEDLGIIEKTPWQEDVKDGYKDTISGGSGYRNSAEFNEFLEDLNQEDGNR